MTSSSLPSISPYYFPKYTTTSIILTASAITIIHRHHYHYHCHYYITPRKLQLTTFPITLESCMSYLPAPITDPKGHME